MMSGSAIFCGSLCAHSQTEDLLTSGHWTSSLSTANEQQYDIVHLRLNSLQKLRTNGITIDNTSLLYVCRFGLFEHNSDARD